MARLDIERQQSLEPKRIQYAIMQISKLNCVSEAVVIGKAIEFLYKGSVVRFYPYSGWFTGKTVVDGRGINNLLNQLK